MSKIHLSRLVNIPLFLPKGHFLFHIFGSTIDGGIMIAKANLEIRWEFLWPTKAWAKYKTDTHSSKSSVKCNIMPFM